MTPADVDQPAEQSARSARLTQLLEALIAYAIDPTKWDNLAETLARDDAVVAELTPSEWLAHLSQAESLAWQLKGDPNPGDTPYYGYVALDARHRVLGTSGNLDQLDSYVRAQPGEPLELLDPGSQAELSDVIARSADEAGNRPALVTLRAPDLANRFGYLLTHSQLPMALRMAEPDARSAVFVAQDAGLEQLRTALQGSFSLTDAECTVALKLASGLQIKEIAQVLSVSVNTVRNHLRAVFEKSGINRQSDLILVVTQMSVILAATRESAGLESVTSQVAASEYPPYQFGVTSTGRRLAYRRYGGGSRSVVCFHESVGSSRLLPGTAEMADERDLQIIAIDRPGCGCSDVRPDYSLQGVAEDTLELLDQLGISQATYLSLHSGAAHALVAAALDPGRVEHLFCVSGRLPGSSDTARLKPLAQLRTRVARQPWILDSFFNILRSRSSAGLHRRLLQRTYGASAADRALLERAPEVLAHLVATTQESFLQTARGAADELRVFAHELVLPEALPETLEVTLWHGTDDAISSPAAMRQFFADRRVGERTFQNAGSLLMFQHWTDVLNEVSQHR